MSTLRAVGLALCLLKAQAGAGPVTSAKPVAFEAELASHMTYPFTVVKDNEAAGGLAVAIAEGAGGQGAFADGKNGQCRYAVSIPGEGTYLPWLRVRWNGNCSNSVLLKIGDRPTAAVTTATMRRWHWAQGRPIKLSGGTIGIALLNREDGIKVDQIMLTAVQTVPRGPWTDTVRPTSLGEATEPRVFFGAFEGRRAVLAPTDFELNHRGNTVVPIPAEPCLVLPRGKSEKLTVWIRNGAWTDCSTSLSAIVPPWVDVQPKDSQAIRCREDEGLKRASFTFSVPSDAPMRQSSVTLQIRHPSGRVEARRLRLSTPYDWLVAGPFPSPRAAGIEAESPIESDGVLAGGSALRALRWQAVRPNAFTPSGLVDMRRALADGTHVLGYARTRVRAPADGDYLLDIRHDDMVRVWINGEHMVTGLSSAPSVVSRKLVVCRLRKGENSVLVKLCQVKNYWEFGVGFLTLGHRFAPVEGVAFDQWTEGEP